MVVVWSTKTNTTSHVSGRRTPRLPQETVATAVTRVLLLLFLSYDVVDELGVLLAEAGREPLGGRLQVAVHRFGLVRQNRNGALGGRPHRGLCGRTRFPRRAVEPFQIADTQGDDQRQRR